MKAQEFKSVRKKLGLTQRELALQLNLSIQQISNYETDRNPIPKIVEMALDQLSTGGEGPSDKLFYLSPNEREVLQKFISAVKSALGRKLVFAIAFGSRVRGDFSAESDLDVLLLLTTLTPSMRHHIYDILFQIDPYYDTKLSPVIYTLHDFQKNEEMDSPFVERIKKEGVLL